MCGRYKLITEFAKIVKKHPLFAEQLWEEFFKIHPQLINRVEIFPGGPILVINNLYQPELDHWTIAETFGDKTISAINAKAETIEKKPMFRKAFSTDRVLIPATGLYEWQLQPNCKKLKYEITFDEPVFAFGGIARDCKIKDEIKRCTAIITTHPNEIFKEIHNTKQRQAVVIHEKDYEKWLNPETPLDDLKKLMEPLPSKETHAKPVEPKRKPDDWPSVLKDQKDD